MNIKESQNLQEKNNVQKNWRLIQLMTSLENYQGFALKGLVKEQKQVLLDSTVNYKNQVSYKNLYITNPLIPIKAMQQNQIQEKECNLDFKNSVLKTIKKRFPINANFVAQWLSENIVSTKAYKLSLLCDRIIKESKLTIKKKEQVKGNRNAINEKTDILVGIKIIISGRILGAEIATSKTFKAGQIPSNTIKIYKDIGFALAKTRSGTIGIKVIYFWSTK